MNVEAPAKARHPLRARARHRHRPPPPARRACLPACFVALFHAIGAPLVLQALAAAPADERIRAALRRRGDDLRAFSALFVRDALGRGELPPGTDVDEIAAITTMLLDGALVAVAEQGDAPDRDEVRDRVVRGAVAVSGLRPAAR